MTPPGTAPASWCPALLGLGSNLGDRLATLRSARRQLAATAGIRNVRGSQVYLSPPLGDAALHEFLNAAVLLETTLAPLALLQVALAIEQAHDRVRTIRWGPRTLDIDLLWMQGVVLDEPGLTVPHPGLGQRGFVLRPVADLLPELILADGRLVRDAVEALGDDGCVHLQGADLGG